MTDVIGLDRLSASELADQLVPGHWRTYNYARRLEVLDRDVGPALLREELRTLVEGGTTAVFQDPGCFVLLARRSFESEHFGRQIWRVGALVCGGVEDAARLFAAAVGHLRSTGADLLTLDLDAAGLGHGLALSGAGFYPVSSKITHAFATHRKQELAPLSHDYEIREPRAAEQAQVETLALRQFRTSTLASDPHLDSARALAVYRTWIAKAFSGEWADIHRVAVRDGAVLGYACNSYDPIIRQVTGKRVYGNGGLAFSAESGTGVFSALMHHFIEHDAGLDASIVETNAFNSPVLRYCSGNRFHVVGNRLSFHRWLG